MNKRDPYCNKILAILFVKGEKIRFNDLKDELKNHGVELTVPTLIRHLGHLTAKRYITRKREGKQNVTYQISLEKFSDLEENTKAFTEQAKEEKAFKSLTLEDQVRYATLIGFIGDLRLLRINISGIINSKKELQDELEYTVLRNLYNTYKFWLIDYCKESKENASKTLEILDRVISEMDKPFLGTTTE